jgi:CubicO group peptidase (beta-lactamase class C family)
VAAYWRGEKVVDLWGGRRTPEGDAPWDQGTMVVVQSVTKGLSAMTLAVANARGWLDYEAPVASYWPEFAQNGKAAVTVRQLLGHEAGLVLLDERLTNEMLRALDYVARLLARQKPALRAMRDDALLREIRGLGGRWKTADFRRTGEPPAQRSSDLPRGSISASPFPARRDRREAGATSRVRVG